MFRVCIELLIYPIWANSPFSSKPPSLRICTGAPAFAMMIILLSLFLLLLFVCFCVLLLICDGARFDSLGVFEMKCVMITLFPASPLFFRSEQNGSFVSRNGNFIIVCAFTTVDSQDKS